MRYEGREEQLHLIIYSAVCWMSLCILVETTLSFKSLTKKKSHDVKNRILSIIHGLYCLILSGYQLVKEQSTYAQKSTELQHFIVLTSMGYFIYDFLACEYLKISSLGLVIHHSLAIGGYASCEYFDNSTISLMGLFQAEISNAPMHLRAILRTFGMRYTKSYELLELFYMVFYIVARGIFMSHLIYTTFLNNEIPLLLRITGTSLWIQSIYYIRE